MGRRSRETASPDITPLIDVVFLLLIFFMVSTVFKKDELALLLNLPKSESGARSAKQNNKTMVIELSDDGIAIDGKKQQISNIDSLLMAITNKQKPIDLRVDKRVRYERLVKVLDSLKKHELLNISLITKK